MKRILMIALLILPFTGMSQQITDKVDIEWGTEVEGRRVGLRDIVGKDATGYYARLQKKSKIILAHGLHAMISATCTLCTKTIENGLQKIYSLI